MSTPKLILASASERRRVLLARLGIPFDIVPADVDEQAVIDRAAGEADAANDAHFIPRALALAKARVVADARPHCAVMGADTVVWLNGRIIGKPRDRQDAREILRALSRNAHLVITGLALIYRNSGLELAGSAETRIWMRPMSEAEISTYVESGEADGKAGAYAIQETADRFVARIEGSFSNVVGLPLGLAAEFLLKAGFAPARIAENGIA